MPWLCHGCLLRTAQLSKSIQYGCLDVQLVNLALKGVRHHPFAQPFDAVHLGLNQTSPVVVNLAFPDTAPQAPARSDGCIPVFKNSSPAQSSILAWRNDGYITVSDDCFVGGLCVVGTSPARLLSASSGGNCASKPLSTEAWLTLLLVMQIARICQVSASMPMCSLRR